VFGRIKTSVRLLKIGWSLSGTKAGKEIAMFGKVTKAGLVMLALAVLALVAKLVGGHGIEGTDLQAILDAIISILGLGGGTVAAAGIRRAVGRIENGKDA
jgi:hypothetical protein